MEDKNKTQDEVLYKIIPKFNIIYELLMPTGKKIKSTFVMILFFLMITIFIFISKDIGVKFDINSKVNFIEILKYICIFIDIVLIIKLILNIVFQNMQYKNMSYTFYKDHMIYEDDFLNQHKKNIQYSNIKEVEIRRTIWDRIIGYGIIVIYTNAENDRNNGLIIYSVKNPKEHYEIIDKLVHSKKENVM